MIKHCVSGEQSNPKMHRAFQHQAMIQLIEQFAHYLVIIIDVSIQSLGPR